MSGVLKDTETQRSLLGGKNASALGAVGSAVSSGIAGGAAESQIQHLTKLVHILWKEAEKLEKVIQIIPEGLRIKSGKSEVLVLSNGGIIIDGSRIELKTPGKTELMF